MTDAPTREDLAALAALDRDGAPRPLGALFGDGPVVLVFLRHYACPSCSRVTHAFLARAAEIRALGARLVILGVGSPEAMQAFAESAGVDARTATLATDPTRAIHARAGMLRSAGATFGPRAIVRSLALYLDGHWRARRKDDGDVEQQGGVLVLPAKGGPPSFVWRSRFVGDDVSPADALDAVLAEVAQGVGT